MAIRVGTCGYQFFDPGEGWQDTYESTLQAYSDAYQVGELNRTFYSLPMVKTAERWRREAVEGFEFTVKAWQAMTHSWGSPTWNDNRDEIPDEWTDDVGYLQPTEAVRHGWEETRKRAEALAASIVVLQTPPGFDATEAHAADMRELLGTIDRGDLELAWEPRGTWHDNHDWVGELCDDLDLIHVVDIFRDEPVSDHEIAYVRLHGRNEDRYDYDYDYDEAEIDELAGRLRALDSDHADVYCLFNNYEMHSNATALLDRL
ncbi:MAG: DUF72 domain-containing protein [Halodesulfurarchaeum sp.]